MSDRRAKAAYYPNFLKSQITPDKSLTATELQILHLICADKSNAEIGSIINIKLPLRKKHTSVIF